MICGHVWGNVHCCALDIRHHRGQSHRCGLCGAESEYRHDDDEDAAVAEMEGL